MSLQICILGWVENCDNHSKCLLAKGSLLKLLLDINFLQECLFQPAPKYPSFVMVSEACGSPHQLFHNLLQGIGLQGSRCLKRGTPALHTSLESRQISLQSNQVGSSNIGIKIHKRTPAKWHWTTWGRTHSSMHRSLSWTWSTSFHSWSGRIGWPSRVFSTFTLALVPLDAFVSFTSATSALASEASSVISTASLSAFASLVEARISFSSSWSSSNSDVNSLLQVT